MSEEAGQNSDTGEKTGTVLGREDVKGSVTKTRREARDQRGAMSWPRVCALLLPACSVPKARKGSEEATGAG